MTRAAFGCAILLVAGCTAPALTDAAPVVAQIRIIDGDTFEIDGEVVRIANIDTPEKGRRAQCFAEARLADAATEALEAHAADWRTSPPDLERQGRDRYGRTLALVKSHGQDVGAAMIESGHAVAWTGRRFRWCEAQAREPSQ